MGFFDWIFSGSDPACEDAQLMTAVDRVLHGIDPRLKLLRGARERLVPAVQAALVFARETIAQMPESLALTADNWGRSALLRAIFAHPRDIAEVFSESRELHRFIDSGDAAGSEPLFGVLAATRIERGVLGAAMEGGQLRRDVLQKTISFGEFRLAGFSRTEADTRRVLEDFVLEQLGLAAMSEIACNRRQAEHLECYHQLLSTRLRLMEQSGAGLATLFNDAETGMADLARLRGDLAANAEALAASRFSGRSLEGMLERVIDALRNARTIIQPQRISLCLNAMNVVVDPQEADCAPIELLEFSAVNSEHSRRVACLVSFPRSVCLARQVDLDALGRLL